MPSSSSAYWREPTQIQHQVLTGEWNLCVRWSSGTNSRRSRVNAVYPKSILTVLNLVSGISQRQYGKMVSLLQQQ
jgi:hypothetical protein